MTECTVLSDGAWGTALALTLLQNGHNVTMWGPFPDYVGQMRERRENFKFLPGIELPPELQLAAGIGEAVQDSELLVLASPSQYMRGTLDRLKPHYRREQLLVNVAKGIENETLLRMSELCHQLLGHNCRYSALSGPSHAEEVSQQKPTAVVVASSNQDSAEFVQEAFMNQFFRVYTTDDVISVELGGALKNVLAIAAGGGGRHGDRRQPEGCPDHPRHRRNGPPRRGAGRTPQNFFRTQWHRRPDRNLYQLPQPQPPRR